MLGSLLMTPKARAVLAAALVVAAGVVWLAPIGEQRNGAWHRVPAAAGSAPLSGVVLTRLDGSEEALTRYAGRTVILNVWATWCAPCRRELPALQRLSKGLDPERFAVIGISIDDDADFVAEYLRDVGIGFANYIDIGQGITRGILGVASFPQTVLIGADGVAHSRIVGERAWDQPDAVAEITTLHERTTRRADRGQPVDMPSPPRDGDR